MKNIFIGIIALCFLLVSFSMYLVQGKTDTISIILLILGLIISAIYLVTNKSFSLFLKSKGFKYGTNSLIMTIIFITILVFVQIIAIEKKITFDLTQSKSFTLSEQTKKVLDNLKKPIKILVFSNQNTSKFITDLLEQYKNESKNISFEVVDPSLEPVRAKDYNITLNNTIIFETKDRKETIFDVSEEKFTNALVKITREGKKKIYFVEGHGEKLISKSDKEGLSVIKTELEKQSYIVESLIILQKKAIPEDANLVVITGAQKNMLEEEITSLKKYIDKGGKVLVLIDPDDSQQIKDFVANYNIQVRNDIIVDKLSRVMGGGYLMPMINTYPEHPITNSLRIASIFPFACSLDINATGKNSILVEPLASTNKDSWGETNKELLKKNKTILDDKDNKGPLVLAAVATIPVKNSEAKNSSNTKVNKTSEQNSEASTNKKEITSKLIVFGNSTFMANGNIGIAGNIDLALNTLNWLTEENDLIAIKPKDKQNSLLNIEMDEAYIILLSSLLFLPIFIILTGILFITRRRIKTS